MKYIKNIFFGYRFEVLQISNSYYTYRYLTNLYRDSFALRASLRCRSVQRFVVFVQAALQIFNIFEQAVKFASDI